MAIAPGDVARIVGGVVVLHIQLMDDPKIIVKATLDDFFIGSSAMCRGSSVDDAGRLRLDMSVALGGAWHDVSATCSSTGTMFPDARYIGRGSGNGPGPGPLQFQ